MCMIVLAILVILVILAILANFLISKQYFHSIDYISVNFNMLYFFIIIHSFRH